MIKEQMNQRVALLCKEYKQKGAKNFYSLVARHIEHEYGVELSVDAIRGISRRYRRAHKLNEDFEPVKGSGIFSMFSFKDTCGIDNASVSINKDGSTTKEQIIALDEDEELTPETLMQKHNVDPTKFELCSSKSSMWQVVQKDGKKQTLYSSKIVVKPLQDVAFSAELVEKIFNKAKIIRPVSRVEKSAYEQNGEALLVCISDLHYNLRTSAMTTGKEHDIFMSEYAFINIFRDILCQIHGKKFEKIYFTIGGDMLNADNLAGTTTKGTPQTNDLDMEDAIVRVSNMILNAIETLRRIAPVEVVYVPGNHDSLTSFGIANSFRMYYSDCDDVVVDFESRARKYKTFGNTLILFAHDVSHKNINDIIQAEARELLGETKNTVAILQHLHHEKQEDKFGTDIRRVPTVSPLSRWAYEQGYSSTQKNQTFILDKEHGITNIIYSFVS